MVFLAYAGEVFRWGWSIWWFDVVMHFLGGIFATMIFYAFSRVPFLKKFFHPHFTLKILLLVFLSGVGWEIWEAMIGWTYQMIEPYPVDTAIDLVMDMLGVIFTLRTLNKHFSHE